VLHTHNVPCDHMHKSCFIGVKDLEYIARTRLQKGHTLFGEDVCAIYGRSHLVTANLFLEAAANGGKGGVLVQALKGEGLLDPVDPWNQPKGDLIVKVGHQLETM